MTRRLSGLFLLIIVPLLLLVPPLFCEKAFGEQKIRIAILPFENMSEQVCNIDRLMNVVYKKLEAVADFPSKEDLDNVLIDLRLRHTGFLNTKDAVEIGRRLSVQGILTGIITLYRESPEPQIGLILKLIGTGRQAPLLWMKADLATGSDMETWFGLNKIMDHNQLINGFIERLMSKISFESLKN